MRYLYQWSQYTEYRQERVLQIVRLLRTRLGAAAQLFWKSWRKGQNILHGLFTYTWASRSVQDLDKWLAKFRTGKFCPRIALTICIIHFHLPENGREGVKLVSKMALEKWNTNFRLEYSIRKNRTSFSDVPLLPEIFRWEDLKIRVPFIFQPDFPENFLCMVNNYGFRTVA